MRKGVPILGFTTTDKICSNKLKQSSVSYGLVGHGVGGTSRGTDAVWLSGHQQRQGKRERLGIPSKLSAAQPKQHYVLNALFKTNAGMQQLACNLPYMPPTHCS